MARPCEACRHPEREQIDAAIVASTPFRTIGQRYEISHVSLIRHRDSHMAERLAEAAAQREAAESATPTPPTTPSSPPTTPPSAEPPERSQRQQAAEALDIVGQLRVVNSVALNVMSDARRAGDGRLVLLACDRVQKQLELQAKLLGQLDDRPAVNIWLSPEWAAIEGAMVEALAPFPPARLAVVERLGSLRSS